MSDSAQSPAEARPPRLAELPPLKVTGLSVRTTNTRETSASGGRIGPLWQEFLSGSAQAIPGVANEETIYSVYTHYESDETEAYDVILGKAVSPGAPVPASMTSIAIPGGRYLVFPVADSTPHAIQAAWRSVYDYFAQQTDERRAFTADFEEHSKSGSRILIALR